EKNSRSKEIDDLLFGRAGRENADTDIRSISFPSLVVHISVFGYPEQHVAIKALHDMEDAKVKVPGSHSSTYDPNALERQLSVLRKYRTRLKPKTDFWSLLW